MMDARTSTATAMHVATLRALVLFFFGDGKGTETKLYRTPHWGQTDNNELYL